MARRGLIIDGVDISADYGVWLDGIETLNAPERDGEFTAAAGKNGELYRDGGRLKNQSLRFRCFIPRRMELQLRELRPFLLSRSGYVRIQEYSPDPAWPDYYRMGVWQGPFEIEQAIHRGNLYDAGSFNLDFFCKPQRFLIEGDTAEYVLMASGDSWNSRGGAEMVTHETQGSRMTVPNDTYFPARPMVRAYFQDATAVMRFTLFGTDFTVEPCGRDLVGIDLDARTCYWSLENLAPYVTVRKDGDAALDYPALEPGGGTVSRGTNCRFLQVIPRWWT